MSSQDVLIRIQATPNPNAWKFVLDRPVLNEGKATYADAQEAAAIVGRLYGPLARQYLLDRRQSTLAWRLRTEIVRVKK